MLSPANAITFFRPPPRPPLRVQVPESLRLEILEARAAIENKRPLNLEDAAPALTSIFSHWHDEIGKMAREAMAPFNFSPDPRFKPKKVSCDAMSALEFFVRDFPTWLEATPYRQKLLFSIFDLALRGEIILFPVGYVEPVTPERSRLMGRIFNFFRSAGTVADARPALPVLNAAGVPAIAPVPSHASANFNHNAS